MSLPPLGDSKVSFSLYPSRRTPRVPYLLFAKFLSFLGKLLRFLLPIGSSLNLIKKSEQQKDIGIAYHGIEGDDVFLRFSVLGQCFLEEGSGRP